MSWGIKQFDQLYHRYNKSLYLNIRKYINDEGAAEDILQEVFIALWNNREKLQNIDGIPGWLFVVSSNKAISYLRQHIQESIVLDTRIVTIPDQYETETDLFAAEMYEVQWTILEQAIESLPEKRQQVFRLCRMEGKTYKDTAQILGISVESVKDYVKKSNKSIKEYIEENYQPQQMYTQGLLFFLFSLQIN